MRAAAQLGLRRDAPGMIGRCGDWTSATLIARCAFFALGVLAAGLTAAVFALSHVPAYLLVTALIAILAAEWLILHQHLFAAGIEEALEGIGWVMMALQVIHPFANSTAIRDPFLIALAFAVAGSRLLNPLFITLSVVALSFAVEAAGAPHAAASVGPAAMAALFCFAVAWAALLMGGVEFQRPSYDRMLEWLIVALPPAGYLWVQSKNGAGLTLELLRQAPARGIPALVLLTFGIAALVAGIRRRRHAPLLTFMVCVACLAYELRRLTGLPPEVKLIAWGSLVLLPTLALDRHLRTPRGGVTSRRFDEPSPFDLLQFAGAGVLTPNSVQNSGAAFKGGGGAGGGGGASGSY